VGVLSRYPNLLVLRTLSKALGFAGARCGAVIGSCDVIGMLGAVQAPYAVPTPVVECVEDALQADQLELADAAVARIIEERQRIAQRFSDYPFVHKVWPSSANFFLVQVKDAGELMRCSGDDKVLLRYFGGDLSDCVRISVGSPAENDALLRTMARVDA